MFSLAADNDRHISLCSTSRLPSGIINLKLLLLLRALTTAHRLVARIKMFFLHCHFQVS